MSNSQMYMDVLLEEPQCQYFVIRKKRLCRMTVRPGRLYCGEHEPQLETSDEKVDKRITCPNDSKHTCFANKLEKHLRVCNARNQKLPDYIVHNVNAGCDTNKLVRHSLSEIPLTHLSNVIDKINNLFEKYLKDVITTLPIKPIHSTVAEEFNEPGRSESSLRHLRQASSLLHLIEEEGLVQPNTCYIELGAGKGQLAVYVWNAWGAESSVVLVERAALRHKRDSRAHVTRLRADLAHLALAKVPEAQTAAALVPLAKHLCGAATDLSLRCICAQNVVDKVAGVVIATCCHHRCEREHYVANQHLESYGIEKEDFNVIVGIVSWATCGDGRSRDSRDPHAHMSKDDHNIYNSATKEFTGARNLNLSKEYREEVGRRAKSLLDWGRVLYLQEHGFDARLVHYVPTIVSLENVCIVATKCRKV